MSVVSWSHIPKLRKSLAHYRGKLDLCRNQTEMHVKPARKLLTFLRHVICRRGWQATASLVPNCNRRAKCFLDVKQQLFVTICSPTIQTKVLGESHFVCPIKFLRTRGIVVVEALYFKPEGRWFEIRWGEWIVFNLPNPSSRTKPWDLFSFEQKWVPEEEEEYFWGVKRCRYVKQTTL
jgi:hypothetical protein